MLPLVISTALVALSLSGLSQAMPLPAPTPVPAQTALAQTVSTQRILPVSSSAFLSAGLPSTGSHSLLLSSALACIFRLQENSDIMSLYPEQLSTLATLPDEPVQQYQQQSGYYAVHYPTPQNPQGAEFIMADDEGGTIAIFKGEVNAKVTRQAGRGEISPVYRADGGLAAVPTGQIFVRFATGVDARERAADLDKRGYKIVKVLDFAPQGAWVKAKNDSIPESLENLRSLKDLAQVEKIEPQMLMERSLR